MKTNENLSKGNRNTALDIVRCVALYLVISVHFFWNTEFYITPIEGERMYLMVIVRTACMVCVPLFIILTGYLMNKKQLCKKYYLGLTKTIVIYVMASMACVIYKRGAYEPEKSPIDMLFDILDFSGSSYAWYMEMYIGLFLLIPFLNLIYNNLKNQKEKQILLITFIVLTSLSSVVNIYNFDSLEWWKKPSSYWEYQSIIPDWWTNLYPVTYYYVGCYLNEYKFKMSRRMNAFLLLVAIAIFGIFNCYRSYGSILVSGAWEDWGSMPVLIMSTLLFALFLRIDTTGYSDRTKGIWKALSDLCLGAYLVSYIFDDISYPILNARVPEVAHRLNYHVIVVPYIFVCSLVLSFVLNALYQMGCSLANKILARFRRA